MNLTDLIAKEPVTIRTPEEMRAAGWTDWPILCGFALGEVDEVATSTVRVQWDGQAVAIATPEGSDDVLARTAFLDGCDRLGDALSAQLRRGVHMTAPRLEALADAARRIAAAG